MLLESFAILLARLKRGESALENQPGVDPALRETTPGNRPQKISSHVSATRRRVADKREPPSRSAYPFKQALEEIPKVITGQA